MGIMYIMLIASLVLATFFFAAFIWAAKSGQFTDDDSPAVRILFENETNLNTKTDSNANREV